MRSGELHYLDHPAFGMVAQAEPVAVPAEFRLRVANLEPRREVNGTP